MYMYVNSWSFQLMGLKHILSFQREDKKMPWLLWQCCFHSFHLQPNNDEVNVMSRVFSLMDLSVQLFADMVRKVCKKQISPLLQEQSFYAPRDSSSPYTTSRKTLAWTTNSYQSCCKNILVKGFGPKPKSHSKSARQKKNVIKYIKENLQCLESD